MNLDVTQSSAALAGLALVLAALLSGAFHRGRAAIAALVLLWLWFVFAQRLGLLVLEGIGPARLEPFLLGAPLLLCVLAVSRETVFRSRLALGILIAVGALSAGAWLLPDLFWNRCYDLERAPARWFGEPFLQRGLPAPGASAYVSIVFALLAVLRGWRDDDTVLYGVAAALLAAGWIAHGVLLGAAPWLPLLLAGVALAVAAGRASYRMAFLDALTGLPTRRMLDERMARMGRRWAVAMVDVDHFKQFNDTHGHDVGDQVLKMVAACLRAHFGADAYRYGGEEFSVLFVGNATASAEARCDAFRQALAERTLVLRKAPRPAAGDGRGAASKARKKRKATGKANEKTAARGAGKAGKRGKASTASVSVTVSIGLAHRTRRRFRPEVVLKAADVVLYAAKQGGRNRVNVDTSSDEA